MRFVIRSLCLVTLSLLFHNYIIIISKYKSLFEVNIMKRILLLFTLFLSFFSYNFAYNYIIVDDLNTTKVTLIDLRIIYARERNTHF